MMTADSAQFPEVPARVELMRRIKELLRQAPTSPVPFFGDAQEFRDFAGNRLVIEIDPSQVADQFPVQKVINGKPVRFADHLMGRADWKPHLERLERSTVYREIADLLAHDHDYRATPIYAELKTRIEKGKPPVRNMLPLDSIAKLDLYFDKVVELIASIATSGYRRRPRYNGMESAEEASRFSSEIRPVAIELTESEIGVAVGLGGSLHRIGPGTHRLAIARLLKLSRVPVEVRMFHVQWLRRWMEQGHGPLQAITTGVRAIANQQSKCERNGVNPPSAGNALNALHGDPDAALRLREAILASDPPFRFSLDDAQELFGLSLLIEVCPAAVTDQLAYRVDNGGQEFATSDFFVAEGDWRELTGRLDQQRVAAEVQELLDAGLSHQETNRYQRYRRAIGRGRVNHFNHTDFDSVCKLDAYFGNLCRLIDMARRFGILPRPEPDLDTAADVYPVSSIRPAWQELSERNIGVAIGSAGELFRIGPGKHRFAVARALDLASVPCEVRMIHADLLRDTLRKTGDALSAVGSCINQAMARQQELIAAARKDQARNGGRELDAALKSRPRETGRFVFRRQDVPDFIGRLLLVWVDAGTIDHRAALPAGFFIGKGNWAGHMHPLPPSAPSEREEQLQAASLPPAIAAIRSAPHRIALSADGTPVALAGEADRFPRNGWIVAEVAMIHAAFLRASLRPDDETPWDAVLRCLWLRGLRSLVEGETSGRQLRSD